MKQFIEFELSHEMIVNIRVHVACNKLELHQCCFEYFWIAFSLKTRSYRPVGIIHIYNYVVNVKLFAKHHSLTCTVSQTYIRVLCSCKSINKREWNSSAYNVNSLKWRMQLYTPSRTYGQEYVNNYVKLQGVYFVISVTHEQFAIFIIGACRYSREQHCCSTTHILSQSNVTRADWHHLSHQRHTALQPLFVWPTARRCINTVIAMQLARHLTLINFSWEGRNAITRVIGSEGRLKRWHKFP